LFCPSRASASAVAFFLPSFGMVGRAVILVAFLTLDLFALLVQLLVLLPLLLLSPNLALALRAVLVFTMTLK
jgi:hypothetical protein